MLCTCFSMVGKDDSYKLARWSSSGSSMCLDPSLLTDCYSDDRGDLPLVGGGQYSFHSGTLSFYV